ncbi:Probable phosphoenolpyruvate synthase (PEP synthase) (Pyruvate [Durusdinium trenchii]|uniref:pyruvate, water dikinase n=1 Tax=Durusdinium trenchii TaxID=1381693 RepID=A0ABP0M225_9DINO
MTTPFTLRLEEMDVSKAAIGGGKGASLGELVKAGARVPAGFVVTRGAFDLYMEAADPQKRISQWLAELHSGGKTLADTARAIAELLAEGTIPNEIGDAIGSGVEQLGVASMSVRSSATCEDGSATAWAGQLETYLDVSPEEIEEQVQACWHSIFRAPALAYGAAHGYGVGEFGVAVVVQEMVSSEVSGIGFSVHPVTQEPELRLIEACFGLGEAIVSGRIMPDQYVVKRGAREIVENTLGRQREGLFFEHGRYEPHWQQLGERGSQPKLNEDQVLEYAGILDRIEDHYGFPVDTEWALTKEGFHLLQSRPITTLAKEYREPIIDTAQPWVKLVRRPLSLLETSFIGLWLDSRHAGEDMGTHVDRFMAIQDDSDLATMFLPKPAFDAVLDHIRDLDRNNRPKLIGLLEKALEVFEEGRQRIERNEVFTSLEDAVEHFVDVGRYTTSFPSCTLIALEDGHIDDPQVRALSEQLRAHSLYPRYLSQLVEPLVIEQVKALGFSAPERGPELVTWSELRENLIDRETLEERLNLVREGYRFVIQILEDGERVNFVSETGYLLMRQIGQRQIIPPDDPDRIAGQAAWPGVYRGRARVLMTSDPDGVEMQEGEVLVSLQSNPNLMPLLRLAGAIVTDDGGVACHAGIICRELKIPTIIGTGRATATINTGDLIEVDATEQVVRILERA